MGWNIAAHRWLNERLGGPIVPELTRLAIQRIRTISAIEALGTCILTALAVTTVLAIEVAMLAAVLAISAIEAVAVAIMARLVVLARFAAVVVARRTVVIALRAIERPVLGLTTLATTTWALPATLRLTFTLAGMRLNVAAHLVAIVVTEFVAIHRILGVERLRARQMTLEFTALAHLLLAIGQDYAIVMLCMLQIILSQHPVPGRQCIASKRYVFFGNMSRRAADFHIRTRALKTAR